MIGMVTNIPTDNRILITANRLIQGCFAGGMYIGDSCMVANGPASQHNDVMCNVFKAFLIGLLAASSITLTSCGPSNENASSAESDRKSPTEYLNDNEIRNLITNNLLMTAEEVPYGYGYLFYPNNRGMKLSEWSSRIAYLIRDGWLCIIPIRGRSSCYRFRKSGGSIYRVHFRDGKSVIDKMTIKRFIKPNR